MVALMVMCEQVLQAHEDAFLAPIPSDWRESALASRADAPGSEVICLGDSQIKKGIVPEILGERLGRPSYNLAVIGGQPPSSYFLLRRALAAGARPGALILGAFPGLLSSDIHINNRQWPELLSIPETLDVAWHARDGHWLIMMLLARSLPSTRMRHEIRTVIVCALQGKENPNHREALMRSAEHRARRGAELAAVNAAFRDEAGPLDPQALRHRWKCKPVHLHYLRRTLRLAQQRGIAVYWLTSTLSPAWQARRDQLGLDRPYDELLKDLQRTYPNLTVIDVRHSGLDAGSFADAGHVDERGASALTQALAQVIKQEDLSRPDRSRWLALTISGEPASQVAAGAGRGHR